MPNINETIVEWLHGQQDWLQQAAETLLAEGCLSDSKINELVTYLKTSRGQEITTHRQFDDLSTHAVAAGDLRLTEIGDISGIENLAPRQPLNFGKGNLCVIYGHNGSGKSGYTRLLTKICGKPQGSDLKPNVFEALPAERRCKVSYSENGVEKDVEWPANSAPIDALRCVDIFDAEIAVAYLIEETAATYTPRSVALFEELANVCSCIRDQLQSEREALVGALPRLPDEFLATQAGDIYGRLGRSNVDGTEIQHIVQWELHDQEVLDRLGERLNTADPGQLARNKRKTKQELEQLVSKITTVASAFGKEGLDSIRSLRAEAINKRRMATEAAKVESAELEGVGTDTWCALWEAARVYSSAVYPGQQYPVTEDALCVLCHQELGEQAQRRLREFEGFVHGRLETAAKGAEESYRQALDFLPTALTEEQSTTACQAAGLNDGPWELKLMDVWRKAGSMRAALLNHEASGTIESLEWPTYILEELSNRAISLEREATQHDEDAKHFDRAEAAKDKLNLEARKWTAQQAAAILAELERLRKVGLYDNWKRSANYQGISRKAGEIGEQVITQLFVDHFNRELKALGASRIKVELCKARTTRGKSLHKLRLKGAQTGQDLPESILSEGERRVVGLAAFLADVAEQPHAAPFVFDDPISSLDHDYEWHVAVRLAQLAQTRQVLVFTHRLSLYGAMEDAAKKVGDAWKNDHLQQLCIESFSGAAGHPADQAVWNANTKRANNILLQRLDDARKVGEASGAEAYRSLAQGICSDFRKLLERTVEDDLLNQVVRRHRRSITTDNRLATLPLISSEDCQFIDDLMTKYSCYEHSQSTEVPAFIPEADELRADIETLKIWRDRFKRRREESFTNT
ncbi:AAA family ATPase [Marinobacter shengliensis]|uniref:AAA family ATPase n=1 Tax=Marinobacter shengliensis TaxID=1389223 RepID=UPI0035B902C9